MSLADQQAEIEQRIRSAGACERQLNWQDLEVGIEIAKQLAEVNANLNAIAATLAALITGAKQ